MKYIINDFANLPPMKYYDNPDPKTESAKQKRSDILLNVDNKYIATEKHDGYWGMFIHYSKGHNLIRSRSISTVTHKYGDYTPCLPHLVADMDKWPDNTVVLGEICLQEKSSSNKVGTILRCLPEKAIARQKEDKNKLKVWVFDVLMLEGEDMTSWPYRERYRAISPYIIDIPHCQWFEETQLYQSNLIRVAEKIIENGGEGLVLQLKDNPYFPGERPTWKTLKFKKTLPHLELKVIKTIEPQKYYEGIEKSTWEYKIGNDLVTKPYYYGWKNGVVVDFEGVPVEVTSGLTDADREWLASVEAQEQIQKGELYAEVRAMEVNSQKSLRHPSLVQLRPRSSGVSEN